MSITDDQPGDQPAPTDDDSEGGRVVRLDPGNDPAVKFLDELYASTDEGWLTGIVIGADGTKVMWSPVGDSAGLVRQLAPHIGRAGVYFGVSPRSEQLGSGRRGGDIDCATVPALWVDIDIDGAGHHSGKRLATDIGQAFELLGVGDRRTGRSFTVPPSMIVSTGGGIHAYWLTVEPMEVTEARDLNVRLHGHLSRLARNIGFEFDQVQDPARILRLPGTKNVKAGMGPGGYDVTVWWPTDGSPAHRYNFDDLDERIEALPEFDGGADTGTKRLSDAERSSAYFTGDSPFAILNQHVLIPEAMSWFDDIELVKHYRNGNITWRRLDSENEHNFVYYADDDHLACYTDQHGSLRKHREYHTHSLLIDGFFAGDEKAAAAWCIEKGYVREKANAKAADFEGIAERLRTKIRNEQTTAEYAEAVAAGEEPPRARLRGVDAFLAAQFHQIDQDIPLVELDRHHLPSLGMNSLAAHGKLIDEGAARLWVVRDLIIAGQHGVLSAGAKTGKTTTVADLAVAVASGRDFLGCKPIVKSGPVLVLLGEGGVRPFRKRVQAIAAARLIPADEVDDLPIYASEHIPKVSDDRHLIAMAQAIADIEEHAGKPPVLVVLDPWYLAAGGQADTGNLYAMGELLDRVQRIIAFFPQVAIMVVHHHNRDRARTGVERMSGAGPMEWGRFLIALDADPDRDRTPEDGHDPNGTTDVTIVVSVTGGEVPGTRFAYRRVMSTTNPIDAARSPDAAVLAYSTTKVPVDAEKDPNGLAPGREKKPKGGRPVTKPEAGSPEAKVEAQRILAAAMQRAYDAMVEHPELAPFTGSAIKALATGVRAELIVDATNELIRLGFVLNNGNALKKRLIVGAPFDAHQLDLDGLRLPIRLWSPS